MVSLRQMNCQDSCHHQTFQPISLYWYLGEHQISSVI